jgi:G6PDH family F420-dependent oxidoreductase
MSIADPIEIGYWLSSEEHGPRALVDHARLAEEAGFRHAMISDHFHPWVPAQGHAPFVWGVLGAIAEATSELHLATGVSAPIARIHPLVLAHAAATASILLDGRFALGIGSGERLNEHVTGEPWPRAAVRRRMLAESIEIIRKLFAGDEVSYDGTFHSVEHATLYSRPATPPPIWVAGSGPRSAQLAGTAGDGLIAVVPASSLVEAFEAAGGSGKPRVGQLHVCWAEDASTVEATVMRWWPQGALPAALLAELARPAEFAHACELVDPAAAVAAIVSGPDPEAHARAVLRFGAAGFTRVYVHQIGPDQAGFLRFWERHVRPLLP